MHHASSQLCDITHLMSTPVCASEVSKCVSSLSGSSAVGTGSRDKSVYLQVGMKWRLLFDRDKDGYVEANDSLSITLVEHPEIHMEGVLPKAPDKKPTSLETYTSAVVNDLLRRWPPSTWSSLYQSDVITSGTTWILARLVLVIALPGMKLDSRGNMYWAWLAKTQQFGNGAWRR